MIHPHHAKPMIVVFLFIVAVTVPLHAQYREYYVFGKVLDRQGQPLADVEITLREKETSQSYFIRTNKKGEFRFVGINHGIYDVQMQKPGYVAKSDEWKLEVPQEQMVRVEIPNIVLLSLAQMEEIKLNQHLESELKTALELIQGQDIAAAETVLKRMLEKKPDDANALYLLGMIYTRKAMYAEAVIALSRVTEINPKFAEAFYSLGSAYFRLQKLDQALVNFIKALELDPEKVEVMFNTGLVLYQMNRTEEALAHFQKALAKNRADPELFEMAGRCLVQLERFAQAVEVFIQARALSQDVEKNRFYDEMISKLKPRDQR